MLKITLKYRYYIKAEHFEKNYGTTLLQKYHNSPSLVVSSVFSDFEYLPWLFSKSPAKYFQLLENRLKYINWLVEKTKVPSVHDLETNHFLENHGIGLYLMYKGSPKRIIDSLGLNNNNSSNNGISNGKESSGDARLRGKVPHRHWVRHLKPDFPLIRVILFLS